MNMGMGEGKYEINLFFFLMYKSQGTSTGSVNSAGQCKALFNIVAA